MDPQSVSLYRAITGSGKSIDGKWIHAGVTDQELAKYGISCSNQSWAQYQTKPGSTGTDLRVPGLPVFLNFFEATYWFDNKKFTNPPAIIEAQAPIEYLFGDSKMIKLLRNHWDKAYGHIPTLDEIQKHVSEEQLIRGECFIQGMRDINLNDLLRPLERVYRPNQMQESKVYVPGGFNVIELS